MNTFKFTFTYDAFVQESLAVNATTEVPVGFLSPALWIPLTLALRKSPLPPRESSSTWKALSLGNLPYMSCFSQNRREKKNDISQVVVHIFGGLQKRMVILGHLSADDLISGSTHKRFPPGFPVHLSGPGFGDSHRLSPMGLDHDAWTLISS